MIEGINALHITEITTTKFYRCGPHPSMVKLWKKQFPLGWIKLFLHDSRFDLVWGPEVIIQGQSRVLKRIECKSGKEAIALRDKLRSQLEKELK